MLCGIVQMMTVMGMKIETMLMSFSRHCQHPGFARVTHIEQHRVSGFSQHVSQNAQCQGLGEEVGRACWG